MRVGLLFNPRMLVERLAVESIRRRRLGRLRGTVAHALTLGHIDSLELLELLRPNPPRVIYDIGANIGTWTLLAKAIIPDAGVEAFEPLETHQSDFSNNTRDLQSVGLHPIALGSENTSSTIHVTDFTDASSLLPLADASRSDFGIEEVCQVTCDVRRLDDYRADRNLPWPDLIKLDVQGYELEVLNGASACLQRAKAVLTEASFIEYYAGQCLFHDVVTFLGNRGFFVRAFGVNTPIGSALKQTDVLFERMR